MSTAVVLETDFTGLTLARRGKVRDVYDLGTQLLIVTTDRISAFDYVLGSGIPDKGKVLTQLSKFWFDQIDDLVPHHLISIDVDAFPAATRPYRDVLCGRSMLVRKTEPVPIECIARGYLSGSGWKDYQRTGAVSGVVLPKGLRESDRLPATIFTPATKLVGGALVAQMRDLTLKVYERGVAYAASRGIIIADAKFEFGLADGTLILIDEVLTPDSSRFWPQDTYVPGQAQPSFDKQFVRDHLEAIGWNKQPPVPSLPEDVIEKTREKYVEVYRRLTGSDLQ
jgi:phosphoribosylaminoimidazole-succinocarboxamide synthase